jgi:hypothetical protein
MCREGVAAVKRKVLIRMTAVRRKLNLIYLRHERRKALNLRSTLAKGLQDFAGS